MRSGTGVSQLLGASDSLPDPGLVKICTLTTGIYIYTTILTEDCLWRKNNWNIITRIHQPCFSKFVMVLHQHQYIQLSDSGLFKSYQFSMLRIKLFRDSVPLAYCCTTEQLTRPFIGSTQAWAIIIIAMEMSITLLWRTLILFQQVEAYCGTRARSPRAKLNYNIHLQPQACSGLIFYSNTQCFCLKFQDFHFIWQLRHIWLEPVFQKSEL